jgi:hypothetical protein
MKNRALLLSLAFPVVLALSGCAHHRDRDRDAGGVLTAEARAEARAKMKLVYPLLQWCEDASCNIGVTATACDKSAITADPPALAVTEKGMVLVWTLRNSPGYTFDRKDGIYFKDDNDGQFKCKRSAHSDVQFQCTNRNRETAPTPFKYGITLVYGGKTCQSDPIIINGF